MSTFKGDNHSIDYQVQAFAKARFCASFFFNDNNNRNNFKQMKKKIIIIISEVPSPYDLVVGGTLKLSSLIHSLLDFDIKMMFELIKYVLEFITRFLPLLAVFISNRLYQSKTVTTYKRYILAVPFFRRFTR